MEELDSTDKILCTLAYPIGLIALILVLTKKEIRACRYHGFNALFLNIAAVIVFIAVNIILGILANIPGVGCIAGMLFATVQMLFWIAFLAYSIYLAVETNKGNYPTIPYITDFANKYIEG